MRKRMSFFYLWILFFQVGHCFADDPKPPVENPVPNSPPNLILSPEYEAAHQDPPKEDEKLSPSQKLQYEPVTQSLPLLQEKKAPVEQVNGAEYEEEDDLYITPEPNEVVKDEAIVEPPCQPSSVPVPDNGMSQIAKGSMQH